MITKEVIDRIVELGQPEIVQVLDRKYSTRRLELVPEPMPQCLVVSSLRSFADYIRSGMDMPDGPAEDRWGKDMAVHVAGPTFVRLISEVKGQTLQRHLVCAAEVPWSSPQINPGGMCHHGPFPFGEFLDQEAFIIGLQTKFVLTDELAGLLKVVSSITGEEIAISADDGVSQSVTARAGLALKDRVSLPSPVTLRPWRTFRDLPQQPESPFILRAKRTHGGVQLALFEADGGAWETAAVTEIRAWLEQNLPARLNIFA